ncbi:OLC1v1018270C1 [Oldenlandia corymbosa var. corymbosa]|uniref:Kinesin-like protein n=1 Tax=Oldenlandia corymbosa var. corymbosa TaxID=529605 RepID=A0AAV1EB93_OLDCO|nr:OLC1v1018270C1 [Oldenlandia corymbosa var. corymbosa]
MEELKSPPPCPATVTVRRNPPRRARPPPTPSSAVPRSLFLDSPQVPIKVDFPLFPNQDITPIELPSSAPSPNPKKLDSESLKVFLRIRPLNIATKGSKAKQYGGQEMKNAWPRNPKTKNVQRKVKRSSEICVVVKDSNSVTVSPPESLQESKRVKSEVFEGFSHVFSDEASQSEVYEKMVHTLVEDFLKGKSGMLAALGPSGSGKTHTVFGCARDPGMVPQALHQIFAQHESCGNQLTRNFCLSMFEICSENGKSERIFDLLREGNEVFLQQSTIKGLEELVINDALQAESLIACGMLRRATAATNSNSQSSRSQCIINISCISKNTDGQFDEYPKKASLTIVDLAGAEREKKTGNQGLRMVESYFINNTSMVFGLCLRSLLEHQKHPKRPIQKHFQNSLLTRYLREYLEGKKRMALILTVKPGEDDYLETSYLLKQASPYTQIKFTNTEEVGTGKHMKRPIPNLPMAEHQKRMKLSAVESCSVTFSVLNSILKPYTSAASTHKILLKRQTEEISRLKKEDNHSNLKEITVESDESLSRQVKDGSSLEEAHIEFEKKDRQHQIMTNFAKALWIVLKEYREKLEIAEKEVCCLRDDLTYERKRSSDLEAQVKDLKTKRPLGEVASTEVNISSVAASSTELDSAQQEHMPGHATFCMLENVAEVTEDSKDIQAVEIYLDNGATVSIASYVGAKNICEGAVGASGSVGYLQVHKDSKEGHTVSNTRKLSGIERDSRDNTCVEIESDDPESAASCLESSANENEICCSSVEKESALSFADVSDSVCSSPLSPVETADCSSAVKIDQMPQAVVQSHDCSSTLKIDQMPQQQCQKEPDPTVAVVPDDNALLARDSHCSTGAEAAHSLPTCSSQNKQKPKRRLQPVSSNLLKDIGNLGVIDEKEKPKGVKGAEGLETRSKGSLSLLRLLRNDVYR